MSRETEYWKGRWKQLEQAAHDTADAYMVEVDDAYRRASRDLEGQITMWYQRFANNNGIVDMAEARRLLNAGELKEFKWTVQDYIKHGQENGISTDWSKELENASARFHISRYEALKVQLQNTVEVLYGRELDAVDRMAKQTTLDTYLHAAFEIQHQAGVGWDVAGLSTKAIQAVVSKPWTTDGKNFSERIWDSKTRLIGEVQKIMTQNLLTGGNVRDAVTALTGRMGVSQTQAARLVYTENAYFQTHAQGASFKDLGVKRYIYIATLDDRTSDQCRTMDGSVFDMKDFEPGVTAPPLHPWCRSATAPYYDDMANLGERAARDPDTGDTYYVPRSMTYPEWKKAFVDSDTKEGLTAVNPNATIIAGINTCKNVSDVETWMKKQNWFRVNGQDNQNEKISLTGCDTETAKAVASAYQTVFDTYPQMVGRFDSVRVVELSAEKYGQCFTRRGGRVELNSLYFSDENKIKKTYRKDVHKGFHPKGTNWKSVIMHEIGHSIDGTLSKLGVTSGVDKIIKRDLSTVMITDVMRKCELSTQDIPTEVSIYASKDHREWFAECFAESMNSDSPRVVAREFKRQLDEYMNKVEVLKK